MAQTLRSIQPQATKVFDGVTVTANYSSNTSDTLSIGGVDQVSLHLSWAPSVSGDDLDIQVEYSHDDSTWYIEQSTTISAGVETAVDHSFRRDGASNSVTYLFHLTFPVADRFMRLSIKRVGTGGGVATIWLQTSGI